MTRRIDPHEPEGSEISKLFACPNLFPGPTLFQGLPHSFLLLLLSSLLGLCLVRFRWGFVSLLGLSLLLFFSFFLIYIPPDLFPPSPSLAPSPRVPRQQRRRQWQWPFKASGAGAPPRPLGKRPRAPRHLGHRSVPVHDAVGSVRCPSTQAIASKQAPAVKLDI